MTRITIATKLRLAAAIVPIVLLIASPILAGGFYLFGLMPSLLQENQYAELRAADGMESALYKMDWGRIQPDGLEIIKGQERRFVGYVDVARAHAGTREQADKIEQIAQTANPIFDDLRKASPGDDSVEPKLRDLQGLIADLSAANQGAMSEVVANAESRSHIFIAITLIVGLLVPWAMFVFFYGQAGQVSSALREIRSRVEKMAEGPAAKSADLEAIDQKLAELGFPKPNPMFADNA
jgi:hypothetical protein